MKTFKRYSAAKEAAAGRDIIRLSIGRKELYIVPDVDYLDATAKIEVMVPRDALGYDVQGFVTARHLKRLQNANYAISQEEHMRTTMKPIPVLTQPA